MRPWLGDRSLDQLNSCAQRIALQTESAKPVVFVPPGAKDAYYEIKVYETGRVETRPDSLHDWFNALAWLAFPKTKARLNALHAAEIPREAGRRGRLRDLLTIFDEGGAIVHCDDQTLLQLLRGFGWKELFWENRKRTRQSMRITVFGHAVLEQAAEPWPGITCKAIIVPAGADADSAAHAWLGQLQPGASPRELQPLPIFGYPGWHPEGDAPGFYDEQRFFRSAPQVKWHSESARQPLRASAEESPGSRERDAG